jgi:hypothetical protein
MVYTYDVDNNTATFDDVDNGLMALIGSGELTQTKVNTAITAYGDSGKSSIPPSILLIEGTFTSLGEFAFQETGFTSISFSENSLVTTMGINTFWDCTVLTSLHLPPRLTTITDRMCENCKNLETIFIPSTVTSIRFAAHFLFQCTLYLF